MAINLADLVAKLKLDTSQFQSEMGKTKTSTQQLAGETEKSTKKSAGAFRKFAVAAGGAFAAAKVGQFFKGAISAASDLGESMSKVGVVFGDSAGEVKAFSKTASTAIGLSEQKALEAAGTFGNLAVALGLPQDAAADMSTSLVTLASDLASFNNVPTEDALLALRSGLVGEAEPLRKFGVSLSAARIETEAFSLGLVANKDALKEQGGQLTAAQKAQAIYSIIMKDTAVAQGDFARTSGGLANQQRILAAQFENLKARIGQALLPALTKITPILSGILDTFTKIPGPITAAAIGFVGLAGGIAAATRVMAFVRPGAIGLIRLFQGLKNTIAGIKFIGVFDTIKAGAVSLRTSIAGLARFAFNPLTLSIALATTALIAWNRRKEEAKSLAESLGAAMKDEAQGIEDATDAFFVQRLEEEGALKVLKQHGVAISDVIRAIKGEEDALSDLSPQLRVQKDANIGVWETVNQLTDAYAGNVASAARVASVNQEVGVSAEAAAGTIGDAAGATEEAADETSKYAKATDRLKKAFQETDDALNLFQDSLDRYLGVTLDAEEAHDNLIQAQKDLAEALKENGSNFDGNSDKALDNRDALRDVITKNQDYVAALIESGKISRDEGFAILRDRLEALRKKFPAAKDEINKYIRRVDVAQDQAAEGIDLTVKTHGFPAAFSNLQKLQQNLGDVGSIGLTIFGKQAAGKEHGGPVFAHRPYVVGEAGPELFVPKVSGTVIPAGQFSTGSSVTIGSISVGPISIQADDGRATGRAMNRWSEQFVNDLGERIEARLRVGARG